MLLRLFLLVTLSLGGVAASNSDGVGGMGPEDLGASQGGGTATTGVVVAANSSFPTSALSDGSLLSTNSSSLPPCNSSSVAANGSSIAANSSSIGANSSSIACSDSLQGNNTRGSLGSRNNSSSSGGSSSAADRLANSNGSGGGGLNGTSDLDPADAAAQPFASLDYQGATLLVRMTEYQKSTGQATLEATFLVQGTSSDPSCAIAQECYFNKDVATLSPSARLASGNAGGGGSSGGGGGLSGTVRRLLQMQVPNTLLSPSADRVLALQLYRLYRIRVTPLSLLLAPASQGFLVIGGRVFSALEIAKLVYGPNPTPSQLKMVEARVEKRELQEEKTSSSEPCSDSAEPGICSCNGGSSTISVLDLQRLYAEASGQNIGRAPSDCGSYAYEKVADVVASVVEATAEIPQNQTVFPNATQQVPNNSGMRRSRVLLAEKARGLDPDKLWSSAIKIVARGPPAQVRATFQTMAQFMNDNTYNAVMELRGQTWYKFRNATRAKVVPIIRRNMMEGGSLVTLNITTRGRSCGDWDSYGRWPYRECAAALVRQPSSRVEARCSEERAVGRRHFWSFSQKRDLTLTLCVQQGPSFLEEAEKVAHQLMADIRDQSFSFCLWAEGLRGYTPTGVTDVAVSPL